MSDKRVPQQRKRRTFDGKPLKDAELSMPLPVLQNDVEQAKAVKSKGPNDEARFRECAVAQACVRTFGEDAKVRIMRKTAYLSLPGEPDALRFELGSETRAMVESFDRDQPVEAGTMVRLRRPGKRRQLETMRDNWHKRKKVYKPENGKKKTARQQRSSDPREGVVRDGVYVRLENR